MKLKFDTEIRYDDGFKILIQKRPDSPKEWNGLVSSFEEGSFFQTTHWGDYLNIYKGCTVYYVMLKKEEEAVGLSLIWKERVKFLNIPLFSRVFCVYGPILRRYTEENIEKFLYIFDEICRRERVVSLEKMCLPIHFKEIQNGKAASDKLYLQKNGGFFQDWATILIDLQKTEDGLWNDILYSAKKCLKKNEAEDIVVEIVDKPDDAKKCCGLIDIFLKNTKTTAPYFSYSMWDFLKNKERCLEMFVAKQKGITHGGLAIIYFNGIVFEMGAWRSEYAIKENLYVGDAIKWEVIKWAKKKGFRLYDLSGISPNPSTDKERGIRRFKEKWGGTTVGYREYFKIYRKNIYFLYKTLKKAIIWYR